jgi:LPPG:FO 2-phospho-L-lactate transferase
MLGDRDLAMHIARSHRLRSGETLSAITARLASALGIAHKVAPMSDAPLRTRIETPEGWMDFQRWFVGEQCRPVARAITFEGAGCAPSPAFAEALARPDLAAVVLCPSNPYLSVDPILAVAGVREALAGLSVPRIAVSPLVGGQAVKGPLVALMEGLGGGAVTNQAIAEHYGAEHYGAAHYGPLLSHMVIDRHDDEDAQGLRGNGLCVTLADTLMRGGEDRARLASEVLAAAGVIIGE